MVRVPLPARVPPNSERERDGGRIGTGQLEGGVPDAEAGAVPDLDGRDGCEAGIEPHRHAGTRDAHVRPGGPAAHRRSS